jgi:GH24 family phage-related lysozyme (muramidase)
MMPREINAAGYRLIKEFEAGPLGNSQPALMPYLCPAGRLTNGWGNTHNVRAGMAITLAQAEAELARNLDWAETCVERYAIAPNDNEFAAMVSLCFNIGADPGAGFPNSTVLRLHNKGDKAGAAAAFAMWRKMRDPSTGSLVDSTGLLRRRNLEANLYLTAVVAPLATPMPQCVAPEKSTLSSKNVIAGGLAVAAGTASVADQVNQVVPLLSSITTAGASLEGILRLGAPVLSAMAVAAAAYFLWRYIQKRRRGEIVST